MKKIIALILAFSMCFSVVYVSAAEHQETKIQELMGMLDIMVGSTDGNFYPDALVTRAEFTKVAIMASSFRNAVPETSTTSPFGDVPYTLWSAPYVALAVDNGIISGYPDSTFRPENPVLLEEAVTICLKLLGYTSSDYGKVWPSGPISLARSLDLISDVDKSTGENLQRRDVMLLIYNTLNAKVKGSQNELISSLNYTYLEDTTLIATNEQDLSISKNKILTSDGIFKLDENFDLSLVGKKGDAFVKNGDTLVSFIPNEQTFKAHAVYSVLNQDIIVYNGGITEILDVDDNLICYNGQKTGTISSVLSSLKTGDTLKIAYDKSGSADYAILSADELKGPYTVYSSSWMSANNISPDATVVKGGKIVSADNIEVYDIVYYSKDLNLVWGYDNKITGTYQSASPNQENPVSVNISGNTYSLEGVSAFNKLSSNGNLKLGDTITVLLGRNGEIADVLESNQTVYQYGYLIETGSKTFTTASGNSESSNYAKIVTANGTELELKTKQNYESLKNRVVSASISNGLSNLSQVSQSKTNKVSGTFNSDKLSISTFKLADNVKILDVLFFGNPSIAPSYTTVFPQRLDGAELSASDILYVTYNNQGEIDKIFLNDVTGDAHKYGIATKVETSRNDMNLQGSYTLDIDGSTVNYSKSAILNLSSGDAVKVSYSGNQISSVSKLSKLSKRITKVANGIAYASTGETYALGDNVKIYKKQGASSIYNLVDIQDVDFSTGSFTYYYNNTLSKGGRIRVIIWS
ncbi:MAG: S-layer homology domain-containing protein [Clostridia bacterium]|nr:S-layer homology domain-containing protein [Clostridia bacterium]